MCDNIPEAGLHGNPYTVSSLTNQLINRTEIQVPISPKLVVLYVKLFIYIYASVLSSQTSIGASYLTLYNNIFT